MRYIIGIYKPETEAVTPLEEGKMADPETLLLYASIFEKPRRDYLNGPMRPASEICLAAAQALRFMANKHKITPDGPPCPMCGFKIDSKEPLPFSYDDR